MSFQFRAIVIALALLAPAEALARDIALCADLYGKLNALPQLIGNTAELRQYAHQLSSSNSDIRQLRGEMRRSGCGGGSIIALGASNIERCRQLTVMLGQLENRREGIKGERDDARRRLRSSTGREEVMAAIRANSCLPSDPQTLLEQRLDAMRAGRFPHLRTGLRPDGPSMGNPARLPDTALPDSPPPGPARPYDPQQRKVRVVGPQFLQDGSDIDFSRPRAGTTNR